MSGTSVSSSSEGEVSSMLSDVTFDVIPSPEFEDVISRLPAEGRVGVGTPERFGIDPTLKKTVSAVENDYHPVPNLVARFIEDYEELGQIADQLTSAGVSDILVVGGDCDSPVGEFSSAYELLTALNELGYSFDEVGIAGHPSGHSKLSEKTLMESLKKKQPLATYIVTQICLEADTVISWTESVRDSGIGLPIEVGIPGVVYYRRLITYAKEWGVAEPFQFLQKTTGVLGFLVEFFKHKGHYIPDQLVKDVASQFDNQYYNFNRIRLYTFNQVADTENWRRKYTNTPELTAQDE